METLDKFYVSTTGESCKITLDKARNKDYFMFDLMVKASGSNTYKRKYTKRKARGLYTDMASTAKSLRIAYLTEHGARF